MNADGCRFSKQDSYLPRRARRREETKKLRREEGKRLSEWTHDPTPSRRGTEGSIKPAREAVHCRARAQRVKRTVVLVLVIVFCLPQSRRDAKTNNQKPTTNNCFTMESMETHGG